MNITGVFKDEDLCFRVVGVSNQVSGWSRMKRNNELKAVGLRAGKL